MQDEQEHVGPNMAPPEMGKDDHQVGFHEQIGSDTVESTDGLSDEDLDALSEDLAQHENSEGMIPEELLYD